MNMYLLVGLNSYLYKRTSKYIFALTTGYSETNQMKRDKKKSWKNIRIQVCLCKMDTFIGTWRA